MVIDGELPILVSALSEGWVCGRLLAGIAGSNPAGAHGYLPRVGVLCCQVEISATGRSFIRRSPTGCGVSEFDHEALIMRRHCFIRDCCAMGGQN